MARKSNGEGPVKKITRLLLNGKKAGQDNIRQAVYQLREEGFHIEVRTTWESGDVARLIKEAIQEQVSRIIAGGGDGTINEVVDALLSQGAEHIELAVLPLGTANDFATACSIPTSNPYHALKLALTGHAQFVDAVKANERHFVNIATAGFGAQVTATTPVALKNFLGGGAYTLSGLVQAINFQPFQGTVTYDGKVKEVGVVVGAVCNGRMAGGGQPLAPDAVINDGLLDAFSLEAFTPSDIPQVIEELQNATMGSPKFVHRYKVKKIEWQSDKVMPINLDGEPVEYKHLVIEVLPKVLSLVLPENTQIVR